MDLMTGVAFWHRDGEDPLPIRLSSSYAIPVANAPRLPSSVQTLPFTCSQSWPAMALRLNIEVTFLRSPRASRPGNTVAVEYVGHRSDHSLSGSGLFSLVVLMAHALHPDHLPTRQAAWYPKAEPTFVDALATVSRHLWAQLNSSTPSAALGSLNSTSPYVDMLVEIACYAA